MPVDEFDPDYASHVAAACVAAIAEARGLIEAGNLSKDLRDVAQHARDMHDILLEQILAGEPDTVEYLRGLADSLGNNLEELELVVGSPSPPAPS